MVPACEAVYKTTEANAVATPCPVNGHRLMAFVDGSASASFVSQKFVQQRIYFAIPAESVIKQFVNGYGTPRIGFIEGVILENGSRRLRVRLEVCDICGEEQVLIGRDLWTYLGYELSGVPYIWPQSEQGAKEKESRQECLPPVAAEDGIAQEWRKVLEDN
eukprot:gnl/Spiro4/8367_TR4393_c0_g1_i1.p3 gnl/Spiro4/8367_TR4393_c0_g1~~gnl/Spiro4/8367_TR4393_c0_g1_i1.p3  ORF type:complete len:161 (-),score=24.00 gnl/Spiro4/8367_TR4393_c0_g1_i1:312-794(-)